MARHVGGGVPGKNVDDAELYCVSAGYLGLTGVIAAQSKHSRPLRRATRIADPLGRLHRILPSYARCQHVYLVVSQLHFFSSQKKFPGCDADERRRRGNVGLTVRKKVDLASTQCSLSLH